MKKTSRKHSKNSQSQKSLREQHWTPQHSRWSNLRRCNNTIRITISRQVGKTLSLLRVVRISLGKVISSRTITLGTKKSLKTNLNSTRASLPKANFRKALKSIIKNKITGTTRMSQPTLQVKMTGASSGAKTFSMCRARWSTKIIFK